MTERCDRITLVHSPKVESMKNPSKSVQAVSSVWFKHFRFIQKCGSMKFLHTVLCRYFRMVTMFSSLSATLDGLLAISHIARRYPPGQDFAFSWTLNSGGRLAHSDDSVSGDRCRGRTIHSVSVCEGSRCSAHSSQRFLNWLSGYGKCGKIGEISKCRLGASFLFSMSCKMRSKQTRRRRRDLITIKEFRRISTGERRYTASANRLISFMTICMERIFKDVRQITSSSMPLQNYLNSDCLRKILAGHQKEIDDLRLNFIVNKLPSLVQYERLKYSFN